MSELGGLDIGMPGEGGASEALGEEAKQRFSASQQAAAQAQKEEKKAKKRDDNVAAVIVQFLSDAQRVHLATLIARLVALDCPSPFILSVLSLINDRCSQAVNEYLAERQIDMASAASADRSIIPAQATLPQEANDRLASWVLRMDMVLHADHERVLHTLVVDEHNIDGTILQLSSFALQEFLQNNGKVVPFEQLQQLSAGILQSLFTPYMHARMQNRVEEPEEE